MSAAQFRALMEDGNVQALRAAWAKAMPHLPQPKTRREAEMMMHRARTESVSITFPKRAYSHAWLVERNLPSGLPDMYRPKAERMYPRIVTAVGIACATKNAAFKPLAAMIRGAMENAVMECYGDMPVGTAPDPVVVKQRMMHARDLETSRLIGALSIPAR